MLFLYDLPILEAFQNSYYLEYWIDWNEMNLEDDWMTTIFCDSLHVFSDFDMGKFDF